MCEGTKNSTLCTLKETGTFQCLDVLLVGGQDLHEAVETWPRTNRKLGRRGIGLCESCSLPGFKTSERLTWVLLLCSRDCSFLCTCFAAWSSADPGRRLRLVRSPLRTRPCPDPPPISGRGLLSHLFQSMADQCHCISARHLAQAPDGPCQVLRIARWIKAPTFNNCF